MPPKADLNKAGGESSDFPVLCETCLGPNVYVRMSRQELGAECKICTRPFTVFRWLPGAGMRYKKTEICQTCSKVKNVCQTCMLDLQYGLPTQVRDAALGIKSQAPTSNINREYYAQNMEGSLENGASGEIDFTTQSAAAQDLLKRLARSDPNYRRNRPHLCSFFAKGECNRGDACPYRHELPEGGKQQSGSRQSFSDRYHGRNDPVARKILQNNAAQNSGLTPPEDEAIVSLLLSGVPDSADEDAIRTFFTTGSTALDDSAIRSVVVVRASKLAFVNFVNRQQAEVAAMKAGLGVTLDEQAVKVQWGRSRSKKAAA